MRTTIQQLAEFLTVCRGNWRNACFISCNECKCHSPCSGYLMSADADGKPVLIPAAEYERLTAQRIDPSECRGNISRSAFEDIYALYLKLTRGLSFTSRLTLDDCIDRLVTRGLVAEGRGNSEYEALYDLLSCLYIAPVSANPFLRLGAFLKLWIWNGAPFSKAIRLFSRPKQDAAERQIVRLADQALLSSAELIKCAERGVRTLRSDAQLMDCLYDDELTTCENLPILMAASRQARPVSAAIANLYLHKQIVFERC